MQYLNFVVYREKLLEKLDPILDLLADAGTLIQEREKQVLKENLKMLKGKFNELATDAGSNDEKNDQKIILNSLLKGAFFRKTSKLGLEFAKKQGTMVLFIWKLPDFSESNASTSTSLDDLYNYLKRKPYYKFHFTEDDHQASAASLERSLVKYMEAITSSEMRHLSRLEALGLLKIERVAPNYLLIREMIPSNNTAAISSDEVVSELK